MESTLHEAFNPENFRKSGHEIIDLPADYLKDGLTGKRKVIHWKEPGDSLTLRQQNFYKDQPVAVLPSVKSILQKA